MGLDSHQTWCAPRVPPTTTLHKISTLALSPFPPCVSFIINFLSFLAQICHPVLKDGLYGSSSWDIRETIKSYVSIAVIKNCNSYKNHWLNLKPRPSIKLKPCAQASRPSVAPKHCAQASCPSLSSFLLS